MIWAVIAACLDGIAALLHLLIIVNGADWYRFFGAGEDMAVMKQQGHLLPDLISAGIAMILLLWGLYALQSARFRWPFALPWPKPVLLMITLIFALRAVVPLILMPFHQAFGTAFMVWSSVICGVYAFFHALCWWKA